MLLIRQTGIFFLLFLAGVSLTLTGCGNNFSDEQRQAGQGTPDVKDKTGLQQSAGDSSSILTVGGGSSHDFDRWFNLADSETMAKTGAFVRYTDQPQNIMAVLPELDILYLSNNQPLPDPELRKAIFDFVESGNDLLLVHASTWYNWEDWPEYNLRLVGGGSKGHDPYGDFKVEVTDAGHPIMKSVPASFGIKDELYHFQANEEGPEIEVLAKGISPDSGKEYPVVWTFAHGGGRIVGITLGHDGEAHTHQAYRQILRNSIGWLNEN